MLSMKKRALTENLAWSKDAKIKILPDEKRRYHTTESADFDLLPNDAKETLDSPGKRKEYRSLRRGLYKAWGVLYETHKVW